MSGPSFEWNEEKNIENQRKHGVSFYEAQYAFFDNHRVIAEDLSHSKSEKRFYCFGMNKNRGRYFISSVHLSFGTYPNIWSRLLA